MYICDKQFLSLFCFFLGIRSEREHIKLPWNIEDAKKLGQVLDRYKDKYYFEVMSAVVIIYILWVLLCVSAQKWQFSIYNLSYWHWICNHNVDFWHIISIFSCSLQAFAIPGSLFLSILSGFLFKFHIALTLVCTCSAFGATLCYMLSQLVGRRLVKHYFPARAQQWSEQVEKHRNELLSYILFLRMTPLLPNWFINLVAPVIGVPLYPFALGTFLGNNFWNFSFLSKKCIKFKRVCLPKSIYSFQLYFFFICRCCSTIIFGYSSWSDVEHNGKFIWCFLIAINLIIRSVCTTVISPSRFQKTIQAKITINCFFVLFKEFSHYREFYVEKCYQSLKLFSIPESNLYCFS